MKRIVAEFLSRNFVAGVTVILCLRGFCFVIAAAVFGFGIWNLAHLDLTAAQIFIGILWTTVLPLLLACSGLLLPMLAKRRDRRN
jgi:hypothetical protein